MNYYPHHIGDFVRDTARLSDAACMAYLRLMWRYYDSEQPLPNDPALLAFQIGSDEQTVSLLLNSFFFSDGEGWRHKRCEKVIAAYRAMQDQTSAAGRASAAAKAAKKQQKPNGRSTDVQHPLNGNSTEVQREINEPITNNQEPTSLSSEQSPDKQKRKQGSPADHDTARWIFDRVRKVNPTAKEPRWDAWANDIRLMREIDNRGDYEIRSLFNWANSDTFWCANILSPGKLREKWDSLTARRLSDGTKPPPRSTYSDGIRAAASSFMGERHDNRIIDITPQADARPAVGGKNLSGDAGPLRDEILEPVADGPIAAER